MKEIWKPVKGHEKSYEVSNRGRIRSLFWGQILNLRKTMHGYLRVPLSIQGVPRIYRVHQLVAQAFLGYKGWAENHRKRGGIVLPAKWKYGTSLVVHHKNHDREDNRVENLEIMTWSENAKRQKRTPILMVVEKP